MCYNDEEKPNNQEPKPQNGDVLVPIDNGQRLTQITKNAPKNVKNSEKREENKCKK